MSLAPPVDGAPPFGPVLDWQAGGWAGGLGAYRQLVADDFYLDAFIVSLRIAGTCAVICLLVGYPMAYAIARAPRHWRAPLLMFVMLPFWTSFVIRVYAWMGLLRPTGVVNNLLIGLGLIEDPIPLIGTELALHLGIVHAYLPFMILPLYVSIDRLDWRLVEAAADLGCPPWWRFPTIVLPLTMPGILSGLMLVFIPAVGEFVIPDLLGGSETTMIGRLLWDELFQARSWPGAAAIAVAMLVALLVPILVLQRAQHADGEGRR
jgi:putrescine transport system permease protein